MGGEAFFDLPEDCFNLILHLIVLESQYAYPMRLQKLGSFRITRRLCWFGMNAAIQLDDELMLHAKEIQNEPLVRMLPPEFQPGQAVASQSVPQPGLGVSRFPAQFTRRMPPAASGSLDSPGAWPRSSCATGRWCSRSAPA